MISGLEGKIDYSHDKIFFAFQMATSRLPQRWPALKCIRATVDAPIPLPPKIPGHIDWRRVLTKLAWSSEPACSLMKSLSKHLVVTYVCVCLLSTFRTYPSPFHVSCRTNHTFLPNQAGHTTEHHDSEHERDPITTEVIATLNTLSQTTITAYASKRSSCFSFNL